MKSATALFAAMLLAAASAAAQQATPSTNTPVKDGQAISCNTTTDPQDKALCERIQNLQQNLQRSILSCPIAMTAHQGGGLHILRAKKDNAPATPAIEPNITLKEPQGKRIVSAVVTAHGFGANSGTTLLETGDQDYGMALDNGVAHRVRPGSLQPKQPKLSRTLTVHFPQQDEDATVTGDFRLPGFVTLESVELNEVTFADGASDNFASNSGCSAKPDPLMLVSSH